MYYNRLLKNLGRVILSRMFLLLAQVLTARPFCPNKGAQVRILNVWLIIHLNMLDLLTTTRVRIWITMEIMGFQVLNLIVILTRQMWGNTISDKMTKISIATDIKVRVSFLLNSPDLTQTTCITCSHISIRIKGTSRTSITLRTTNNNRNLRRLAIRRKWRCQNIKLTWVQITVLCLTDLWET